MEQCSSLKQAEQLKKELLECRVKKAERVLEICLMLEDYACRANDKNLLGFVFFYRGEAYYILNDVEAMFESMTRSVEYLSDTQQWELLARAYNMMAITSINRGHAPVAVDYYLAALKCAKEHEIDFIICSIHINLGYLYMQNGIYEEAQLHFEEAYEIYAGSEDKEAQIGRLNMIYTNLVSCHMRSGNMEQAGVYMNRLLTECSPYFNNMDYVYVGCMAARYYHMCKEYVRRDEVISDILSRMGEQLPILDLIDDLYSLCELALEIANYEAFLRIMEKLEPVVSQTRLINLDKKLLTLKIRYYELVGDREQYLQAACRFYKLALQLEEESQEMIANMIHVRTALERAQESKKQMEEMNVLLTQRSETDSLTGLANRYRMTDMFKKLMNVCRDAGLLLAVEILDIDYFKQYNDNYGHQAGDECIRSVSSVIKGMQNEQIFCARYGGDEFIIIYGGFSEQEILQKSLKLRKDIIDLKLVHSYSKEFPIVTVSQGICLAVPAEENKELDFLHRADEYLYKVKRNGRSHVCAGNLKGECRILKDEE